MPSQPNNQVGDAIPAERLAEYGRLMLEFAEENRAREVAKVVVSAEAAA
jgi:hypothetical protein